MRRAGFLYKMCAVSDEYCWPSLCLQTPLLWITLILPGMALLSRMLSLTLPGPNAGCQEEDCRVGKASAQNVRQMFPYYCPFTQWLGKGCTVRIFWLCHFWWDPGTQWFSRTHWAGHCLCCTREGRKQCWGCVRQRFRLWLGGIHQDIKGHQAEACGNICWLCSRTGKAHLLHLREWFPVCDAEFFSPWSCL